MEVNAPEAILKQYWGYEAFRTLQKEIIEAVLEQRDVLALLPTGGGKSICYQVPGLILEGVTIVVSPLIALMRDQVDQLQDRGIKAVAIDSSLSRREIDIILDNCIFGDVKFLYVSPERLKSELFVERAKRMSIGLIAIDEAHCISQWGYDFRPPYLEIPQFRNLLPDVPLIALTATATHEVQDDIIAKLEMTTPGRFFQSFARDNISYSVRKVSDRHAKVLEILKKIGGSAIVYVNSRRETKEIALYLVKNTISADYYHAGIEGPVRTKKQEAWIKNRTRVMVSTNAFGMGIDKPDVRLVIHTHIPGSPEAYYQEAGRAGRDGKKSFSVILYDESDEPNLLQQVDLSNPTPDYLKKIYQGLANHLSVAVGASANASYDFDLTAFCKQFNFDFRKAYLAVKRLENQGLIQLNEAFQNPSQVWILLERQELYKFQIEQARFDPLIKTMLRMYGGELLDRLVKISENQVAESLQISATEVKKGLSELSRMGIIEYDQQKDKPQLIFISERHDANQLPIDSKLIKARREIESEKVSAMVGYVKNDVRCRSQILLDYFGEVSYQECGICDTCLRQKHHEEIVHHNQYVEQIINILGEGPQFIEELIAEIEPENEDDFQVLVREMIDRGMISYNDSWQIQISKNTSTSS